MHGDPIERYRLSPQQARLLRLQSSDPARPLRSICIFDVHGDVDGPQLRASLARLARAHDILRTRVVVAEALQEPVLHIEPAADPCWIQARWEQLEHCDEVDIARLFAEADVTTSASTSLIAAWASNPADRRSRLALAAPAAMMDSFSFRILLTDLCAFYNEETSARTDDDPQFIDLISWQHELLTDGQFDEEHHRWKTAVEQLTSIIPADAGFSPRAIRIDLAGLGAGNSAAACGQSVNDIRDRLLAMWMLLASLHSGAPVAEIAVRFDGRNYDGLDRMIGPFARFLPFREAIDSAESPEALIDRIGRHLRDCEDLQEYFDPKLLRRAHSTGDQHIDWAFEFDRIPDAHGLGNAAIAIAELHCSADQYGFKLSVASEPDRVTAWLHFDEGRRSAQMARAVAEQLRALLAQLAGGGRHRLRDFTPVTESMQAELLGWSRAATDATAEPVLVHAAITGHAERSPMATALVQGKKVVTYAELNAAANRLAHLLRRRGVAAEQRVAISIERSVAAVVAMLAVLKAGGAYVPIDPDDPPERQAQMLRAADVRFALATDGVTADAIGSGIERIAIDPDGVATEPSDAPPVAVLPDQLAYVLFTSGSTGTPKGVMVTHRGLANYLDWSGRAYDLAGMEAAVAHTPLSFDLTVTSLWTPLFAGRCAILAEARAGIEGLLATLREERKIGLLKLTPTHLRLLMQYGVVQDVAGRCNSLVIGGEALFQHDVTPWLEANPRLRVFNEYGPTEAVVGCSCQAVGRDGETAGAVAIGRPIDGSEIYLLDSELRLTPPGVTGDIYIASAGIARGYAARPDLTAASFVPHPLSAMPGRRIYRTGDLGRWRSDGALEYCGRADGQIKLRGHRIEIGEIEHVLNRHPRVAACAVALRQDEQRSQIVAYVVPDPTAPPTDLELREFLCRSLPRHMIPATYVQLEALPLGASGKIDRPRLPDPAQRERLGNCVYVPPQTFHEQVLAAVWSKVLGVRRVGIEDSYFALGGDSIHAIEVVAEARRRGLSVSVDLLFACPTIRELARKVAERGESAATAEEAFTLVRPEDRSRLPDGVEEVYPLSKLQAGMLFAADYFSGSAIYHDIASYHLRLRSPLDVVLFQRAVDMIVADQPALRTAFALTGYSEPLQLVWRDCSLPLSVGDISDLPPTAQQAEIDRWVAAEKSRSFDTGRAPLIRLHVHLRGGHDIQFSLGFHHAILDGWSEATFLTELFERYFALRNGEYSVPFVPPDGLISEFLRLERLAIASADCREYWLRVLEGAPAMEIPRSAAAPRRVDGSRGTITVEVPISESLSGALHRLAIDLVVPIKSVLLAAHVRVLSFVAGTSDILTAMVASGRPEGIGGASALGLFLNSVPLRLNADMPSWTELVRACFDTERSTLPYRRFPFAEIKRITAGGAVPDTLFYFTHYHVFQRPAIREEIEVLGDCYYEETSFGLVANFWLNPFDHRIHLNVTCDATQFAAGAVAEFADYYQRALEALIADPYLPPACSDLLLPNHRRRLLGWQGTLLADLAQGPLLHRLVEQRARERPEAVALQFRDLQLSYACLNESANRIAAALRQAGVRQGGIVALRLERSDAMVVGLLGCLKAGAAFLPLDVDAPPDRLRWQIEDADACLTLVDGRGSDALQIDRLNVPEMLRQPAGPSSAQSSDGELSIDAPAYVMYTSGSTGRPKGVVVTHRAIVNRLLWMQREFQLGHDDRVLQKTPYVFDVALWDIFWPLIEGARLVVAEPDRHADPDYLADIIERCGITTLHFVPSLLRAFLSTMRPGRCGSLRRVVVSGEKLGRDLAERLLERLPNTELYNLYGPTEAAVDVTCWRCRREESRPEIPIGRPIANLRVYVLDHSLRPAPIGTKGEIYIAGTGLALGYINRPALTAERFLPDCVTPGPGQRMYRTGDLGRWTADGDIEFLGRIDDQTKIRGYRIEPAEVEARLCEHPGVCEAAVVAREISGEATLVAFVVPTAAAAVDADELRRFLATRLPLPMIPSIFEACPPLPRTASGKLDRAKLGPALDRRSGPVSATRYAYRSPLEEVLCGIWGECLGTAVSPTDNFFDAGGHSIAASRIVALIRERLGLALPLRQFFDSPTVRDLAAVIDAGAGEAPCDAGPSIQPCASDGATPLSLAQQRLWFLEKLDPGGVSFIIPGTLELGGPLDVAGLEQALREVARRHQSLRTFFASEDSGPLQLIEASSSLLLTLVDLRALGQTGAATCAAAIVRDETRRPFDLTQPPLMRAVLLRLSSDRHILVLTLHHIVADGWSITILAGEVEALYRAIVRGPPHQLTALRIQFRDFVSWELSQGQDAIAEADRRFWRRALRDPLPDMRLPGQRLQEETPGRGSRTIRFEVEPAVLDRLRDLSRRNGCTLFVTLLTAFKALVRALTGCDDVAVLTDTANRRHAETEGLIGFFVNQLLLRDDFAGDRTLQSMLRRTRDNCFEAYARQHVPFEQVVQLAARDDRRARRWLSGVPKLVLQNQQSANWRLAGLTTRPLDVDRGTMKVELLINLLENGAGLTGWWEYRDVGMEASAAEALVHQFQHMLAFMGERPDAAYVELCDTLMEEQQRIGIRRLEDAALAGGKLIGAAARRTLHTAPAAGEDGPTPV